MPNTGDGVNWEVQLERLPDWMKGIIVWFKLAGTIVILVAMVGVYVGKDLGLVEDRAAAERRLMLETEIKQTRLLEENKQILKQGLDLQAKHIDNTNAIARNLCFLIPKMTEHEKNACMNGVR